MSENKSLGLDQLEVSLALHALRFYKNAKGYEVSQNTLDLEERFDAFLNGTKFVVEHVESPASLLGARGGTIGGASTSEAKRAAAAENGTKGGRPRNPNLFIIFHSSLWTEPDPKLQKAISLLYGDYTWLPNQPATFVPGLEKYVRIYLPSITDNLRQLLSHSMNVIEWDEKPFARFCDAHKIDKVKPLTQEDRNIAGRCSFCSAEANWIG